MFGSKLTCKERMTFTASYNLSVSIFSPTKSVEICENKREHYIKKTQKIASKPKHKALLYMKKT